MAATRTPRCLLGLSAGRIVRPSFGLSIAHQNGACAPRSSSLCHPLSPLTHRHLSSQSLPYVLQPSFWRSLLPRSMREKRQVVPEEAKRRTKEWNPATFFIAITVLIGSQAIQMIALRKDFVKFSNQTEARLGTLREVVRRIQNGEDVDVEGLLGTGEPQAEKEWEEVIRELEAEDMAHRQRRKRRREATTEHTESLDVPGNDSEINTDKG